MMNDVLHSTNQDVHPGANGGGGGLPDSKVNRLKKRVNSYRKLHESKLPAYEKAMNASNPQGNNEAMMLGQRFQETPKTKKASKKSTSEKQTKMVGVTTKDKTKHGSMNGQPQYGATGRGGIKRQHPEESKNCVDPVKRMNLDPGIKLESPSSVSDSSFDFKYSTSADLNKLSDNPFSKDDSLSFKDDSLGDFDGLMNNDTFNDLMSDLNIPTDFIDSFEFNDKNTLEDLSNVIGSEFGSASGPDDKDDSFSSLSPAIGASSGPGSNTSQQVSGSFCENEGMRQQQNQQSSRHQQYSQQQQQQQQHQSNNMESNAAERLKIMAQQHQSTSQGACGSPMGNVPQRMGSMGVQPNTYHNPMPNTQMQQNPMSNSHVPSGHMSPGGMQISHQGHPPQNVHSRNVGGPVPNLPTMPLPPSMSSPMMSCGPPTPTSDTPPSMSHMSVAQMQQHHQHGSMHNNMTNGPMGNMTNGPNNFHGGETMPMYNNVPHNMMVDQAMVQRAQGRYRLGTPSSNPNMRPGMQMNQVLPGQHSPVGSGMQQLPMNPNSNQNIRQQNPPVSMQSQQQMLMHQMPITSMRPNLMGDMSSRGMMGPGNMPHMNHQMNPQMMMQMQQQQQMQHQQQLQQQQHQQQLQQQQHQQQLQQQQHQQQLQQQQMQMQHQLQMQQQHMQMQQSRPPPPEYGKMVAQQNQAMPTYMMNQMGMSGGAGLNAQYPGNVLAGAQGGGKMGKARGPHRLQQVPPSGPMMRQQAAGMVGDPQHQQQQPMIRFPNGPMMMTGQAKQIAMSHPSPQAQQSPAMWNSGPGGHPMHGNVNMGSVSPHPQSPLQPASVGSPRPQGDYPNHVSPMMPQPMRSQTPVGGMSNQLQNNHAMMSHMRMQGPQMGPVHSPMPMLPQQQQHVSPQQQHQASPMSHPHHSPMNSHMMGGGPNAFVPSPMTSGVHGGPSPENFNPDFLDAQQGGGQPGQVRGGSHSRGNDELNHLYNNR